MNYNNEVTFWRDATSPMNEFRREFDRLFVDWLAPATRGLRTEATFVPPCDVEEEEDHYLLSLEMAGVRNDDIKMEVVDNQIIISGERRNEAKRNQDSFSYSERRYGRFQRAFALPTGANPSQVEAHYQDGILRILVPKAEASKPRQIKITNGSTGSGLFSKFLGQSKEKEEQHGLKSPEKVAS